MLASESTFWICLGKCAQWLLEIQDSRNRLSEWGAKWPHNEPIDVAKVDLNRLREACVRFFTNFAEKAERGMKENFGDPPETRK